MGELTLSFTGEFAKGYGIADQYTSLTGGAGATIPAPPNTGMATAAMMAAGTPVVPTSYAQDIDNGIVTFDKGGNLQFIEWHSVHPAGPAILSARDGRDASSRRSTSRTRVRTTTPTLSWAATRRSSAWKGVLGRRLNLFVDLTHAFRLGVEYANYHDVYGDGVVAINHRAQLSGFLLY